MYPIERLNHYLALLQIRRKAGLRELIFYAALFFGLLLFWMILTLNVGGNMPASSETFSLILMAAFLLFLVRAIVNYEVIRGSIETVENLKLALDTLQTHEIT